MSANPSPLVGYNTNVRHKGKLYHIQTEDSGVTRPHIITQLFADGGRILAVTKTSYDEHLGSEVLQETVKRLMQEQHKGMFIALRDGVYDEDREDNASESLKDASPPSTEVLEHAAKKLLEDSPRYESLRTVAELIGDRPSMIPAAPFGSESLSDKSLDEVILAYLAEDLGPES